ncbi:NADPH:quinone reductase [Rhizina undulata]
MRIAKANGASFVIDYVREDWTARILEITHNEGVHAIFDGVGARTFDKGLEVLRRKGTFVSLGNASGVVPPVTIARRSAKNLKLLRSSVFGYIATTKEFDQYTEEMFNLIAHGKVDVKIHEICSFKVVTRAMKNIGSRKTTGKLLLKL